MDKDTRDTTPIPHPLVAAIPVVVLIGFLAVVIVLFGSDSLNGGSQTALLMGVAVCVCISMGIYRVPWRRFEEQMKQTIGNVSITLIILLCVGMLSGSWMISGIVPTLIYYGVQVMSPQFFLVSSAVICALVSLLSGSSWTTIATIGVALLGIGNALGVAEAWTAGAIISGAYFGDKLSPLSDTTLLASSSTGTDLFEHIRYMMLTTMPTFLISLVIFFVAGLHGGEVTELQVAQYTGGLAGKFNISLWTLLVPLLTGVLIARRVPSLIVLFLSSLMAGVVALLLQPHVLCEIAGSDSLARGLAMTYYGPTAVDTGYAELNELISQNIIGADQAIIGFVLVNMRTKEANFYEVSGAKEYSAAGTPGFHCPWYWHQLIFSCGCSTRTPIAKPFASSAPPIPASISYTSRAEWPVARMMREARYSFPSAVLTT